MYIYSYAEIFIPYTVKTKTLLPQIHGTQKCSACDSSVTLTRSALIFFQEHSRVVGEVAQTMYTHTSKCKNDFKKTLKILIIDIELGWF
jgi:hypothetical protein